MITHAYTLAKHQSNPKKKKTNKANGKRMLSGARDKVVFVASKVQTRKLTQALTCKV